MRIQMMMNDIRALPSSRGGNWNYVACSPLSEAYQQTPIYDKFNTLCFDWYGHFQHFLALIMIHNVSDVEFCRFFPSSLLDSTLCWLASLPSCSIFEFQDLGQKFRHHFLLSGRLSQHHITYSQSISINLSWCEHTLNDLTKKLQKSQPKWPRAYSGL